VYLEKTERKRLAAIEGRFLEPGFRHRKSEAGRTSLTQRFIPKQPSMLGPPNGRIKLATLLGITCNIDTRRKTGTLFLSTQVSYQQIKQKTNQRFHKLGNSRELLFVNSD